MKCMANPKIMKHATKAVAVCVMWLFFQNKSVEINQLVTTCKHAIQAHWRTKEHSSTLDYEMCMSRSMRNHHFWNDKMRIALHWQMQHRQFFHATHHSHLQLATALRKRMWKWMANMTLFSWQQCLEQLNFHKSGNFPNFTRCNTNLNFSSCCWQIWNWSLMWIS